MRTGLILAAVLPALFIMGCKKTSDAPTPDAPTSKAPTADAPTTKAPTTVAATTQTVEAGCGMCIYEMDDVKGCDLAVVIDGHPMLVSGYEIDMHEAGLCSGAKQAVVSGKVEGDVVVLTEVEIE